MPLNSLRNFSIEQLKSGMFVTKLDVSWLDSPFLTHSRLLQGQEDIDALRKAGVKQVVVDLNKSHYQEDAPVVNASTHPLTEQADPRPMNTESSTGIESNTVEVKAPEAPDKTEFSKEMGFATQLRSKAKKILDNVNRSLEAGLPINTKELTPLIDTTLESLARNDQALMTLVNLSRKTQKLSDHVFGCFCLTLNLALVKNVSTEEREQLGLAALLHEAGWAQLPQNLVGKRTRYSATELSLIKKHTLIADQVLSKSALPALTQRIIAEHHEQLDGSGYPKGLKAEQIHPLSQLLRVVDAYEERVHHLTDEPGMVATAALRSLYKEVDQGLLNAIWVTTLISVLGIYPPATLVLLNTGEKAIVRQHFHDHPLTPEILVVTEVDGSLKKSPKLLDLRTVLDKSIFIESPLDISIPANEALRKYDDIWMT